jgi:hypothetical protein
MPNSDVFELPGQGERTENYIISSFIFFFNITTYYCEPGSSVSIVSGYGLDDRAIEVRSPAEAKGFFL